MLQVLARATERRLSQFSAQGIANTTWALATLERSDEKLLKVLAIAAELRMHKFNAQKMLVIAAGLALAGIGMMFHLHPH